MSYTKVGPFNNDAPPYLSKATMDTMDQGIFDAAATADQAMAAVGSNGGMAGVVALDTFAGASDDDKLTNALSFAAAQTYVPTILLANRAHTFSQTRTTFGGMKISGQPLTGWINAELSSGKWSGARVTLACGNGVSSWLVGTATNYDGYIGNIGFVQSGGNAQFFHHPLSAGTAYGWTFDNLAFSSLKYVIGNTTDYAALTLCNFTGRWTIAGTTDTPINIGGSDSDFWINGSCNIGAPSTGDANGKYLMICTSMGKSNIGGVYFTANSGWRALHVLGSTNYGPGLTFSGLRVEGRNPTDPSLGALIKIDGSITMFRDTWLGYAMSNPAGHTDTTDTGVVMVNSGDVIFDGVTYDRASTVGQDVPMIRATGGACQVEHVRPATRGGSWTASPLVSQSAAGLINADSSVRLVTA